MKILVIGDVTSPGGLLHLEENLWKKRNELGADLVIVNGENASFVSAVSPEAADKLFLCGADVITGGNHTLQNKQSYSYLDEKQEMLRPINYPVDAPGRGACIVEAKNSYRVLVLNAMGTVHIEPQLDSPYSYLDRALREAEGKYDVSILDFHAEATGEKGAIAHYFDGRISAIFGTHTHVPTADARILPNGTGFISDVGMCGESEGIIGMDPECVIEKLRTKLPSKFKPADGQPIANAVLFTIDEKTSKTTRIERFDF